MGTEFIKSPYWQRVLVIHIIAVAIISKSFFIILYVTWGGLPERFYNVYMYIGNWPSLISGTFPYFYDKFGNEIIDMAGMHDLKSLVVNIIGWLPASLVIGYCIKKWNAKL